MTTKERKLPGVYTENNKSDLKKLVLFNDEVNTFDFVVNTLIEVCGQDSIQAETCTWIAHYKGKCTVKKGTSSSLKPCFDEMTLRKLTVAVQ